MKNLLFVILMLSALHASSQNEPKNVEISKETGISTLEELIEKDALEKKELLYISIQNLITKELALTSEKADKYQSESEINFSLYENQKKQSSTYQKAAEDFQKMYEKEKKKSGFWKWTVPVGIGLGILIGSSL